MVLDSHNVRGITRDRFTVAGAGCITVVTYPQRPKSVLLPRRDHARNDEADETVYTLRLCLVQKNATGFRRRVRGDDALRREVKG